MCAQKHSKTMENLHEQEQNAPSNVHSKICTQTQWARPDNRYVALIPDIYTNIEPESFHHIASYLPTAVGLETGVNTLKL